LFFIIEETFLKSTSVVYLLVLYTFAFINLMLIINVFLWASNRAECRTTGCRASSPRARCIHSSRRLDANAMRQGNLYSNKREYSIREGWPSREPRL